MKKHKRMLSLLCAVVLAVTLMAPTALALQGPDVSVPDNYDLIYFVDCGAGAFPANIQTLLTEHHDTVKNAGTPDQAYDGTWGYTNAAGDLEVKNSGSDDIYQSIRNFKSGKNGQTLEYKFAGDAGEYRVFVGLYDIWHDSNGGSRKAAVSVNDGAAQSLTYGSEAHLLSFDATVADGNGLSVKVVPTNTAAGDEGDVLVSFIMVTKKAQGPEEPQKPEAPTAGTSIWGKGGENGKLDVVSTCTNPDAAHKGGNTVTEHKNFISVKYFTNFGEMRLNNGVWEVSAEFDAMDYLDEKFGAPHSAQNVSLTLEYVNNKWCVKTDGEKAVINLEGACALSGPEAPVLGENLEVWVQIYSGEYEPKRGSRIDGNTSTYGSSVTFGDVEKTGEQWTCDMTVVGYTKDSNLSDNCYLNKNMPKGYEVDPYELDRDGNAKKTVTLTYNQENGTWECPAIPLKHTSTGPASTSTVKYGVSFKIKNTTEAEGAPALPVDNPVHNGGFWVSLYVYAEETGYEEVYTQVYDGTQDYVQFSDPVEGAGILGTYATTATVNGNDVLAASGLEGYELADRKPIKENELVFDWDSMTWTAQTMTPYFDQPGSTIAKRGLAFKVRPVEGPEAPVLGENLEVWVQIYSGEYAPKGGFQIDDTSPYGSSVTFGDVEKTGEQWTCDMTVVGYTEDSSLSDNCYLNTNMPEGYEVDPYELDRDGNAKKTVTLTYNQENGTWECPAIPLKHTSTGPASTSTVKYGVSFKIKNTTEAEGAPALPVDNPVHNGGFWVSLYVYAEETGYEEVYTQVYDGTQDYVQFSDPVEGAGILGTYATTATVNGNDVLAASGLEGYELADRKPIKENELVFDWDSMTWTAQTMTPYFDQPDSTIAKRGLAFLVRPVEDPAPPLPVPGETLLYMQEDTWVDVTVTCTNENAVHKPANTKVLRRNTISKQYLKAVSQAQKDENGLWTCQVTLDGAAMLKDNLAMEHTAEDVVVTAVYNEAKGRWELPAEPLTFTGVCDQAGPEAPSKSNCTDFYITVYGYEPQVDETVKNISLSSFRWDVANGRVTITFSQPEKNDQGVWTCEATIQAEDWVEEVYQSKLSSHYRRDDTDPTTKTITMTFDQGKGKWVAESDGITYGYPGNPSTKNGVAFRLVKQYTVTYTPGRDLTGRIPEGENVFGGAYDKGAEVQLPQTTGFVTENGVFAGWKVTIKKYINDPDSVTYFYPLGTETMPMFGKDVELEAYWMDVELDVADLPYDENKGVGDYTFVDAANFVIDGDTITVLYRAQVQGKSQYPYALTCDGAQAVYDSQLTGAIDKYQTSKYVYFTVTYTAEEFQDLTHQTVTLGNGASAAAFVTVTVEHQVEEVAGVAPTCTQDGSKAYWHCTGCGKYFADEACTQEIQDIDTWKVIPAIGHDYGEPVFRWSDDGKTCTATFTCGNDASHVEVLNAQVTSAVKTAPTCTEMGVTTYTAQVTFRDETYTNTLELTDIPATGHAYGEPTFQWSADGKTCTVTFTCGNDAAHVETLTAEITSAVKTAPTCTEKGVTVYTAKVTFEGKDYTATLELTDIPATGHAYGEPAFQWSADGKTCTVTFTCGNDETHVETLTAEITSAVKTAPTCTEKGVTVYTAKVTFGGKDYTATLELTDIPAAGHNYEDGVCTVCGEKDPDYVEPTEPTTEPTKPATDPDGPDQTGDTTPAALLMSLLLISAACLTAVIAKSRKIRF